MTTTARHDHLCLNSPEIFTLGLHCTCVCVQKISADPTDPTKFFQQDDTFMKVCSLVLLHLTCCASGICMQDNSAGVQDAFSLATILAFLYVMVRAWFFLESK